MITRADGMALPWNTRQLLTPHGKGDPVPVEFHFLSFRELYDSSILIVDRRHSSAGEWVVAGDHHWYTVAVITRPVYALPQELCLSFDCFSRTRTNESSRIDGPPTDEVAAEFGALLSLLVREPLTPLGVRRISGSPVNLSHGFARAPHPQPERDIPAGDVNSNHLRKLLVGLSNAEESHANAILAAAKLYHSALSLSVYDVSTAYFSLVAAIECLSGEHFGDREFDFDDVEKFKPARKIIEKIADSINDAPLISDLKTAILKGEFFVWQKFRDFIEEFLPDEFWQPDELHPTLPGMSTITKDTLRRFLREAYDARSKFAHTGRPFPAHVEIGVADRVRVEAMHEMMALTNSTRFVPLFVWFERLTHLVLREYLYRVIAPELEECRARRREARKEVVEVIEDLPDEARSSLERLTRWTMQFLGMAIIGPHAPNRVWASSEASIETLLGAGLIEGDSASMDGHSWIKDRYVGEAVGEFFFGAEQNPLLGNTLLHPALRKD